MFLKLFLKNLLLKFNKWRLSLVNRLAYGISSTSIVSNDPPTTAEQPPIRTGGGTLP